MSGIAISPYRLLPDDLVGENLDLNQCYGFKSTGPNPNAKCIANNQYSLGTDSDWVADIHDLTISCSLKLPEKLRSLFGNTGIAANNATLNLVLEWMSADSGARQLGQVKELSLDTWPSPDEPIFLQIQLGAGSIRGVGAVSLQLFLGNPGISEIFDPAIATQRGFRFGALIPSITVVIDGDSSLFPILEKNGGVDGPLWEFQNNWIDACEDTFSVEYVALVINVDHKYYDQLQGRRGDASKQSPLMQQVLASWIVVLIWEMKESLGRTFDDLVNDYKWVSEHYSIAEMAANFVRSGDLDSSSLPKLFVSVQLWLDQRLKETEVVE